MNLYFNANIPEMRSIIHFNRLSLEISETVRRLETGQRIVSAKDDPAGLISRESMRTDIQGIQAAQKNTMAANELLATADNSLANISRILLGDIGNKDDNGLIGLIYDTTIPAEMKKQQIEDILNLIDSTVQATNYNGKRMLDGSMKEGALFQLGKDVHTSLQYRMGLPSMTATNLGGASGKLYELRDIDLETDEGKTKAYAIVNEAINIVARQRGVIGAVQKNVLDSNSRNLDTQLEKVSETEGLISNTDVAWETSRLNRAELLAQAAMNSILYSRSYERFILNLFL
jgi:flagellin